MTLNDLLRLDNIDPADVIVLRHRPADQQLRRVLPWLAAEAPDVFNAYQQTQGSVVENAMRQREGRGYVAAFIGMDAGAAVFVGLYRIHKSEVMTEGRFGRMRAIQQLRKYSTPSDARQPDAQVRWFHMQAHSFRADWKGKLEVAWPGLERSWYRLAENNTIPVSAIHAESRFEGAMPAWDELTFSIAELRVLPSRWRLALQQWRGIYFIRDASDGMGYVGSAYGRDNLYGRWLNYGTTGHGGNRLLRPRDPANFTFSILQRVSPDQDPAEVIRIENSWKLRLHTKAPDGLNDN